MKALVVVQARMGSSRLPGKVLKPLAGKPLLECLLQRLFAARFPFQVCVATSTATEDEPIRQLCRRLAVPVVSGHPTDLLDRHLLAARTFGADAIAKILLGNDPRKLRCLIWSPRLRRSLGGCR